MSKKAYWAISALLIGLVPACGAAEPEGEGASLGEPSEATAEGDVGTAASALDSACFRRTGIFAWHCAGPVPGMSCTQIMEPADPHTWADNFFCSDTPIGMEWSYAGPIVGMDCTQTWEPADPNTWLDNYLCVPPTGRYHFTWSSAGPLNGLDCIQWIEPADPDTWNDNYLCVIVKA